MAKRPPKVGFSNATVHRHMDNHIQQKQLRPIKNARSDGVLPVPTEILILGFSIILIISRHLDILSYSLNYMFKEANRYW